MAGALLRTSSGEPTKHFIHSSHLFEVAAKEKKKQHKRRRAAGTLMALSREHKDNANNCIKRIFPRGLSDTDISAVTRMTRLACPQNVL